MNDRIDNPDIEQQPTVEWTEDGAALRIVAPADFSAEQRREFLVSMTKWWTDYFVELANTARRKHDELQAERVLEQVPEAPECTPWCTKRHVPEAFGWDTIEWHSTTRPPDSAEKACSANLGSVQSDDGVIALGLDRLAVVDCIGGHWESVYVNVPVLTMRPDQEISRLEQAHIERLHELVGVAVDMLQTAAAMDSEANS